MAVILGTAGHIDHGKTTLVRRLTGIDCDRLLEEKRRGITIELGFAWLDMPGGDRLGIVDVPGHERFVKNMVAGASGIDFVMLVIAADEGVMPQTREHLDICSLLGIRHGFVALTKTDMVDKEWLALVTEDVRGFLKGTFLEGAPIFPVSATTGDGLDALLAHIVTEAASLPQKRASDIFRLPVDRVFSLKGHGTIVTGTIISGEIAVGDEACFMPADVETRVRSLQRHGTPAEKAALGQRCAVNVQGLEVGDIDRGQVLCRPGELFASDRWLVRLTCLASSPIALRHRGEVHFHHGTHECPARLIFRDRSTLAHGDTALAEIRFSDGLTGAGVFGDRCVVRAASPLRTVAGGELVCPLPPRLRTTDPALAQKTALWLSLPDLYAKALAGKASDRAVMAKAVLDLRGREGASFAHLRVLTGLTASALESGLQLLGSRGEALCWDRDARLWMARPAFDALLEGCLARATELHERDPLKPAFPRNALLAKWSRGLPEKLVQKVLEQALKQRTIIPEGEGLRLATHTVTLAADQSDLRAKLLSAYEKGGMAPPNYKDVLAGLRVTEKEAAPVLRLLVQGRELVRVKDGLYYSGAAMAEMLDKVRAWFADHDDLDVVALRELLGLTRKYLIALLEYMDNEHITVRVGDQRRLRQTRQQ